MLFSSQNAFLFKQTSVYTKFRSLSYQKQYAEAEAYLLRALDLRNRLLGQQHPYTQGTWNSYIQVIATAIQANQADTLSDHPTTQNLIPKIRTALENP
ncbi:MAG: tetratricopeptide repeat protein [Cyanobacteria bacterium P01_D01_bin.156]